MDISQNNIGYFPQMPICDKHTTVELNSDFSLPDYQPEIRRLLTTRALILPQSEYVGNGNAEIQGEVSYKITYLGADGEIYCASLSDKYGFSAALDFSSHSVNNEEITLLPYCKTESVNSRVLGPRKLNVRAKLDCRLSAFSPSLYSPTLVGAHSKSAIENLIFDTNCINIKKSANESLILKDFITFDTPLDKVRIIDCSSVAAFSECNASMDKINVRGDAVLKVLYCNDEESSHPLSIVKKIPFSADLSCAGVNSLFECVPEGRCFDERLNFEENGVSVEFTLNLSALAQRNETVKYVADAYSTEKLCENYTCKVSVVNSLRCFSGNLTQNDVFSLESVKLSKDAKIVDILGKCNFNELSKENDKLIFKGNNDYQIIYALEGEYASLSLSSPIKYELDSRSPINLEDPFKWRADGETLSLRARHDGERLFVDCELNLCIALNTENTIELLDEMMFGEYLQKTQSEIVLSYPEKGASVWSVAKEYGEPQKNIRAKNSIPENEDQIKKRFLLI